LTSGTVPPSVERVTADLLNPRAVAAAVATAEPDAACHLAALARVRDSRTDPVRYWQTNVGGTLALLAALSAGSPAPRRLVMASTCAVYGEPTEQPIQEDAAPAPSNPYGTSKLAADRAAADLAATGAIGAVSLRSFNIAGGLPGHPDRDESRLIPKIVAVAQGRADELVVNGDGSVVRDYVHVLDMADAFARALDACEPGRWRAYNVGSGRRSTIADVITAAEQVTGRSIPVRHQPPAAEPPELLADAARIQHELGWQARFSDLRQIIGDADRAATSAYSAVE
jgi:UDP-glucose 4-epimerase